MEAAQPALLFIPDISGFTRFVAETETRHAGHIIRVHYGEVALNPVKQHTKLFGKDVIVAHRLMKNTIAHHEYALFTDTLVRTCPTWVDVSVAAWADVETGEETYDE